MVYGTSNKLNATCPQKVPLVKKSVNYMPQKGVKLEILYSGFFSWVHVHLNFHEKPEMAFIK